MPIMYFIGYFYMLVTYEFDKHCIIKHYQKNKEFGKELPLESFKLIKYAVFINLLMSFKVFFNGNNMITHNTSDKHFD